MKSISTPLNRLLPFFDLKLFLLIIFGLPVCLRAAEYVKSSISESNTLAEECAPLSTLPCENITVSLPYSLDFNSAMANTISDKDSLGTGFTMVNPYSGVRTPADGSPTNMTVPGYEPSRLTLANGFLQLLTNKGIASRTENNQLNSLGVRVDSRNKLEINLTLVNPLNGSSFQQAGLYFGLNDKTFIKLVVTGNKVEMLREINDSSTNYPEDQRVTATITGLNSQTVRLRLIIDPTANTAEAFYSTDGTNYLNAGETYATKSISISGMELTTSTAFAGIFGTHRNSSTPVTYTFDNFSVTETASEPDPEPEPATACSPISTLPCTSVQVSLPLNLTFDQAQANTIADKDNQGIGFTMVDAYSGTRHSADGTISNTSVPGYEASKLTLGGGRLQILSNKGIAYLTNNNQLNALGVQFNSQNKYQVETVLINPFNGSSAQQAGIWFGQNDKSFLKLVVVGNKLEFRKELNDASVAADTKVTAVISGLNTQTVNLRLVIDPATNIAEAFYSIDGINYINVGAAYSVAGLSITGMNLTGTTAFAGIFATHRNSSTAVTYTFDNFSVTGTVPDPDPEPEPTTACSPISTLPCTAVEVSLPVNLTFDQAQANTIADQNNQGIGFTMVDTYSGTRLAVEATPSNSSVPGYEPSKLTLGGGRLQIVSTKGIAYLTNNNQLNALGVKFNSTGKYVVETVLINPFNGSSAQQAGLWIGQNDKSFLKLVAVGNKLEFRKELNDASLTADAKVTSVITGLETRTVNLRIVVDPATNSAEAFYSIDGTNYINVGAGYSETTFPIAGMNLTGSTAFAGIYATHRNSSTPVTYTFDNFSVTGTATDPEPDPEPEPVTACSPISTLPCTAVQVSLPVNLTFDQAQANTITDKDNQGIGFTMVDTYSGTRLAVDGTPSNSSVPGYEPSKLTLGGGRLQIVSNKGIAYLTNNNQLNALGVKFNSTKRYQVETVLINPFNGSSAQQAGLWIGQNDKSFLKLVAVGNKLEFRKELNDGSVTADTKVTDVIPDLNTRTVYLRIVVDPATNSAEAFYSADGQNYINVGSNYSVSALNISGMGLTGSTTQAGIFASHRNSSTPVTYTFDNFGISTPPAPPAPEPVETNPNAYMVIENRDNFPAADHLVFSRIQNPWNGNDNNTVDNYNHDKVTLRINNKGTSTLTVNNLSFSKSTISTAWKIVRIGNDSIGNLPINVSSRGFVDVEIQFTALDEALRVKTIHDTLYISSSDPNFPLKKVMLHGNFQLKGEGGNEPRAQEIINTFAFKTRTGFGGSDGSANQGTVIVPNSDEIIPSFFVRADPLKPVTVTQMAAFHSCCATRESIAWYAKGSTTNTTLFSHYDADGQSLLPRLNNTTTLTAPTIARRTFNPTVPFGLKVGTAHSDRTRNFESRIGMRIWKAIDASGNVIPNAYIIGNDYLGTTFTNYDYQDNIYYIENVRPESGTAYYSELGSQPSSVSFANVDAGASGNSSANVKNLGNIYPDGSSDPTILIQRVEVVGPNASEFSAGMPASTTLGVQATTAIPVAFSPSNPGIKNAALMVHYNNSKSPLRIPLYGISNSGSTTVSNMRRIKSNASSSVVIGGQTWEADINYRIGNVKLDVQNPKSDVAGTDDDILYQTYLSSNANYDEIKYEVPLANGNYMIRMHHVENVWQAPGLRVFNVSIENELKYSFLDIFKEVGYRAAIVKDYETTVTDGVLSIKFNPSADRLAIAGLEIFSVNNMQSLSTQSIETLSSTQLPDRLTTGARIMRTYPNPNSGDRLFVDLENFGVRETVNIQMHDIMGRLIKSFKAMTDGQGRLSTEITLGMPLKKEIYIIRASSPSGVKQSKIIID